MKIVQINTVMGVGSTGRIAEAIQSECEHLSWKNIVAYRYAEDNLKYKNTYEISGWWDCHIHNRLALITMLQGRFSKNKTRKFLRFLDEYQPDIVHLHNLHGSFVNHEMLFSYIKKNRIIVVWTLHDCWSFTGHCPYFDMVDCNKWKVECYDCPQFKEYPRSRIDNSKFMYKLKKQWFTGIENLTIITPSQWLGDLVKQSFLKEYPVKVINNGIDLEIFKPSQSDFREKYDCKDKVILLGVAFGWGVRKGLDIFIELSKQLESKYQIVLVGTDENIDKQLPENIISIHRTQNQRELAEVYTAADVFVNPTREDNYPTVNMESIACGTPVITFDTGGSAEMLDSKTGVVVKSTSIDELKKEIIRICNKKPFLLEDCIKKSREFDMNMRFLEYVELYKLIIKK